MRVGSKHAEDTAKAASTAADCVCLSVDLIDQPMAAGLIPFSDWVPPALWPTLVVQYPPVHSATPSCGWMGCVRVSVQYKCTSPWICIWAEHLGRRQSQKPKTQVTMHLACMTSEDPGLKCLQCSNDLGPNTTNTHTHKQEGSERLLRANQHEAESTLDPNLFGIQLISPLHLAFVLQLCNDQL